MKKIFSAALALVCVWFATPAHAALPDGYTQLEYIESTGTQYIDTGVKDTSKVEMDMNVTAVNNDYTLLYGSQKTGTVVRRVVSLGNESHAFSVNVGSNSSASTINTGSAITLNTFHNLTFILGTTAQIIEDGVTYTASNSGDNASTGLNDYLFCYNYAGSPNYKIKAKISYAKIYGANGTLVRDFVPAKNASGAVGMYDTVTRTFFANAGTGEFVAGPDACRNLFDGQWRLGLYNTTTGAPTEAQKRISNRNMISIKPNTQYTVSSVSAASSINALRWLFYDENKNFISFINQGTTITSPENARYLNFYIANDFTLSNAPSDVQIEEGTTATAYVPYCSSSIKIATTKYNESAFSPLNTALQNAISVVDTVVSNTITQAGRIATLQAQKQTRPNDIADDNEKCPAGKKCLLVEDASGVPHWYEIVENAWDVPVGYTQLQYLRSDGRAYINTNYSPTSKTRIEVVAKVDSGAGNVNIVGSGRGTTGGSSDALLVINSLNNNTAEIKFDQAGAWIRSDNVNMLEKNRLSLSATKFSVNGDVKETNDTTIPDTDNRPFYIFQRWRPSIESTNDKTQVYEFSIYENDILVRNFVPAKNPDGKIGMYDLVGGRFYENAGTGEFIGGPVAE